MERALYTRRDTLSFGAALGTLAVASLAGCSSGSGSGSGTGSGTGSATESKFDLVRKMQDRGHAILGLVDSPPSSMVRDGKLTGYNVDIVAAVLKKYDITEFKAFQADFAGMVPGLQASRMDICCAGLLITGERCSALAMSAPTYVLLYSFAVKPGNPKGLTSIASIKDKKAILALESATTQERLARAILPASQIITVPGRQDGADAVRIGRADAYLAPAPALEQVLKAGGAPLEVTETVPDMTKAGSCIAMRTSDADFAKAFADDFEDLRRSGEYATILEKYGADPKLLDMPGVKLTC